MIHPRLVQPLEVLIIERVVRSSTSAIAPILGVIGLTADAVLLISETSSYPLTVQLLDSFPRLTALWMPFGRQLAEPIARNANLLELFFTRPSGHLGISISDAS